MQAELWFPSDTEGIFYQMGATNYFLDVMFKI